MKTYFNILLLLFTCSCISSQETGKIKGDREVISVTRSLDQNFEALEISGNISVNLSLGTANSYTLTTDQNLQDIVQFVIDNRVLKISTSTRITSSRKLEVNLRIKDLERIGLKDGARLKTVKKLKIERILIEADNSSYFDLDLQVDEIGIRMDEKASGKIALKAKDMQIEMNDRTNFKGRLNVNTLMAFINDRSDLNLKGKSGNSSFALKKSADVDAKDLKSRTAEVESSDSAEISLRVSRKLEINASEKSQVIVYGKPDIELKGLTDRSRVIKK